VKHDAFSFCLASQLFWSYSGAHSVPQLSNC